VTPAHIAGTIDVTVRNADSQSMTLSSGFVYATTGTSITYYVATTGNDANACTVDAPCLTIARAEAVSAAGETIYMAAGTYRLSTSNNSSAGWISAKANQTFTGPACTPTVGPTKCTAIISGSKLIGPSATGPDGSGDWSVIGQTQAGTIFGFTQCDTGWAGCAYPEDLFYDGVPFQHIRSTTRPTLLAGQWWFDYPDHTIYFHDDPATHLVETSVLATMFSPNQVNGVIVQNLTVEGFASENTLGAIDPVYGNVAAGSSLNWVIQNCYVTLNHSLGVRAAYGEQVLNSVLDTNGSLGWGGGINSTATSGILVKGNTIINNNYAHVNPGQGAGGIKFGHSTGVVVQDNLIQNNIGHGLHADVGAANFVFDGNTVIGNSDAIGGGDGIRDEIGLVGGIMRNNITQNNNENGPSPAGNLTSGGDSTGVEAYCNVIGVSAQGTTEGALSYYASNRGNNTVQPGIGNHLVSINNNFHHNTVIWAMGATGLVRFSNADFANQPNFLANNVPPDYNEYHASATNVTNFMYSNSGGSVLTFANYQAAGADIHGTFDTINTNGFPSVRLTTPIDNLTVDEPTVLTATTSDSSGITKVEFYIDWVLQATVTSPPYNFTYDTGAMGPHIVAAKAYSTAGVHACWAVPVANIVVLP
jgi:hypothetical protein